MEDLIGGEKQIKLHIFMVVSQSTRYLHTSYYLSFLIWKMKIRPTYITESSEDFNKINVTLLKVAKSIWHITRGQ